MSKISWATPAAGGGKFSPHSAFAPPAPSNPSAADVEPINVFDLKNIPSLSPVVADA
jgi:hypothetical protein